jgi:hypothetical protein
MENKLIKIDGYWLDDKTEFNGYIVSQQEEIDEVNDEDIFYYGLTLDYIEKNILSEKTGLDFVITRYELI